MWNTYPDELRAEPWRPPTPTWLAGVFRAGNLWTALPAQAINTRAGSCGSSAIDAELWRAEHADTQRQRCTCLGVHVT